MCCMRWQSVSTLSFVPSRTRTRTSGWYSLVLWIRLTVPPLYGLTRHSQRICARLMTLLMELSFLEMICKKDFSGLHYINTTSCVKYLMGILQVQPDTSGPKYLLGNSSNNPSNQKPVIVIADILKHAICMVEVACTTNMTDCVFKVGDSFTKTSVGNNPLGQFISDKKRILPLFL